MIRLYKLILHSTNWQENPAFAFHAAYQDCNVNQEQEHHPGVEKHKSKYEAKTMEEN